MTVDDPRLRHFRGKSPVLGDGVYLDPSAQVIGDVVLGGRSSVWMNAVVRGDVHPVRIGDRTNVQDLSLVHVTGGRHATFVGNDVTIGHHVTLHGCRIGDRVLVGIGAIVLDGVEVGDDTIVAAASLLPPGKRFPPGVLLRGSPAAVVRDLTPEERASLRASAERYVAYADEYRRGT